MKRYTVILFILGLVFFPFYLFPEGGSLSVTNGESDPFYFVLDPEGFDELAIGNPAPVYEWISEFFKSKGKSVPFSRIDSGETQFLNNLYPGTHLLVGFFKSKNSLRYPVKVLGLTVKKEINYRTSYTLYREPVLLTVPGNKGILKDYFIDKTNEIPVVTVPGNTETDTLASASFSDSFRPSTFTRKRGTESGVYPISNSEFWGKDGTRPAYFKVMDKKNNKIGIQAYSEKGFSKSLSYFLYLYLNRSKETENTYTVEVKPVFKKSKNGFIVLWEKGKKKPLVIGSVSTEGSFMNGEIDLMKIPFNVTYSDIKKSNITIDLTSCWFNLTKNSYEEFFLSTLDIIRR